MLEVGVAEAEHSLRSLMERAETGEEVLIKNEAGSSFRLVVQGSPEGASVKTTSRVLRMREEAKALRFGSYGWEDVKADRDEGRS